MTLIRFPRARSNPDRRPTQAFAPRSTLLALEPRTLYDGAAAVVADKVAAHPQQGSQGQHEGQADHAQARAISEPGRDAQPHEQARTNELLFVDTTVSGWQNIVAQAKPNVQVILLDPARDPIDQIAQTMSHEGKVDAIHIVSHGADGTLQIGGRSIDLTSLQGYSTQLATIGEHLTTDGDILLYGCDIGEGAAGAQFVQALARATGADVAASTDATGAAARGGDWTLEYSTGQIDVAVLHDAAYTGLLDAPSVTGTMKDASVAEPSSLNADGASTLGLSGWTIADSGQGTGTVTVDVILSNTSAGSLVDASGHSTAVSGGLEFTGSAAAAQAWVNQLSFTAADTELGNTAAKTTLTVKVTDQETVPLSSQKSIDITVTPSNDPTTLADGHQNVDETNAGDGSLKNVTVLTTAALNPSDPEVSFGTQNPSQIVYRIDTDASYGYLVLHTGGADVRLGVGSVFTQADVIAGNVRYVHTETGASQDASDSFTVTANDGATPQSQSAHATVTLDITPVNQAPSVSGTAQVYEGQSGFQVLANSGITFDTGGDPGDAIASVTIESLPTQGTLLYNGNAVTVGQVILYADLGLLTYNHNGKDPGDTDSTGASDSFKIVVTDTDSGGTDPASSASTDIKIAILAVDDDPTYAGGTREATVAKNGPDGTPGGGDDYRVVLDTGMLSAADVDSSDVAVSFVVSQLPSYGQIVLLDASGNVTRVLAANDSFTLADLKDGRVAFDQTGAPPEGDSLVDGFKFQIIDNAVAVHWDANGNLYTRAGGVYGAGGASAALTTFDFTVNLVPGYDGGGPGSGPATPGVNTVVTHAGTDPNDVVFGNLTEGGSPVTISGTTMLSYSADGVDPSQIVYTVTGFKVGSDPADSLNGTMYKAGVALGLYSTFTQQDLDDGKITF